jgi:hypothetical protein
MTLIVFSAVHMIPMLMAMFIEPTKPLEVEAKRAMAAVIVDIGPFQTDWRMLNHLLSASYSALLFFVAALNLVALPAAIAFGGDRFRGLAMVNVIFVGLLLAISLACRFPPPAVFCVIAEAFFIAALVKAQPTEVSPASGRG